MRHGAGWLRRRTALLEVRHGIDLRRRRSQQVRHDALHAQNLHQSRRELRRGLERVF
jgi:hypothetical protein